MPWPKVIIVLGSQRGGTTIFGRLLGELEGFVYAGEVRRLWLSDPRKPCSCGQPLDQCPLWSRVLERVCGGGVTREEIAGWQAGHLSNRHSWLGALRLLWDGRTGCYADPELAAYAEVVRHVYGAVAELTGARVVVDASKHPNDAVLLRQLSDVPSYVVQIVRDPRGSAHSVQRRDAVRRARRNRAAPEAGPDRAGCSSARATLSWLTRHAASEAVRRLLPADRSLLVRYEDLVERPLEVLGAVAAFVGESPQHLPDLSAGAMDLGVSHSPTSGKRMLAERMPIRLDERWMEELSRGDAVLTAALAWPLMRRYGYPLQPPLARSAHSATALRSGLQQRR